MTFIQRVLEFVEGAEVFVAEFLGVTSVKLFDAWLKIHFVYKRPRAAMSWFKGCCYSLERMW